MEIIVVRPDTLAATGARLVHEALTAAGRAEPTLMPALGRSALGVYRELGRLREAGRLDVGALRIVQLDEYDGLSDADPRLLYEWLRRDVARPLDVPDERIIRLGGEGVRPGEAARRYDAAVRAAGGVDVAVLGLGPNGHLGFNEPPSDAAAVTRLVDLSPASLASNEAYWPGLPVPRRALTAGMSTILAARRIILVVSGGPKRTILRELLLGPITPELPASFLRQFPMATLIVDEDAWPEDVAWADRETAPHGGSETPEKVGSGSSPSGSSGPGSSAPGSSASAASGTAAASAPSGAERVGGQGRPQ